jgi:hypothetical protein
MAFVRTERFEKSFNQIRWRRTRQKAEGFAPRSALAAGYYVSAMSLSKGSLTAVRASPASSTMMYIEINSTVDRITRIVPAGANNQFP